MSRSRKSYKSDLTDEQWAVIGPLLNVLCPPAIKGKPREVDLREVLNTIFYQGRSGCQWDMLPHDLLPKSTVYDYFARWRGDGTLDALNRSLVEMIRMASTNSAGKLRDASPSAAAIDSQSVKATQACDDRGYDAGKKISGRKRNIAVDTLGLLMAVVVTVAGVQDSDGAELLVDQLTIDRQPNLEIVWADGGYHRHKLHQYIEDKKGVYWALEIIKRSDDQKGFVLLPKRWVVERTFSWLDRWRRMSKDYEHRTESAEAWVKICSIGRMLRYIKPPENIPPFKYRIDTGKNEVPTALCLTG